MNKISKYLTKNHFTFTDFAMKRLKVKNIVVFESNPELSGNSYEVYQELISKSINKTHDIYWLVDKPEKYKGFPVENVHFLPYLPSNEKERRLKRGIIHTAKLIVSENRVINKTNIDTFSLHLHHGTVLKDVSGIYDFGINYDCILCPSDHLKELYKRLFKIETSRLYVSGYPRNDLLFHGDKTLLSKINCDQFDKIILWMPTFRQHKNKIRSDTAFQLPLGIPIFSDLEEMKTFNEKLKVLNYLLALKLHPAQDKTFINAASFSNIKILEDEDLTKHQIKLYEFIGLTDALITDYSSIYYDYLLLGKPIGLTNDDIEDYKLGFVYRDISRYLIGDEISTTDHLSSFVEGIKNEKDRYHRERNDLNGRMNAVKKYKTYTEEIYEEILKKVLH